MTHMQNTSNIGWRNNYSVRFTFIRFGMKQVVVHPILIPLILYFCRIIFACNFHIIITILSLENNFLLINNKVQKYKNYLVYKVKMVFNYKRIEIART